MTMHALPSSLPEHGHSLPPKKLGNLVYAFASILRSCNDAKTGLRRGALVHAQLASLGCDHHSHTFLGNLLLHMYARCARICSASAVFNQLGTRRNVFSWNLMIDGYAHTGQHREAIFLLGHMATFRDSIKPDKFTFIPVLSACSSLKSLNDGILTHAWVDAVGLDSDPVLRSALIHMYGKCDRLRVANKVFNMCRYGEFHTFHWNAMIAALAQNGHCKSAVKLFFSMSSLGLKPDGITFLNVLEACTDLASYHTGKTIHDCINRSGLLTGLDYGQVLKLETALVNMYGRCGNLMDARSIFENRQQEDSALWTVMIAAYARNGHVREALELFKKMRAEESSSIKPDPITLVSVLAACSHYGLLDEGQRYFRLMVEDYGITPSEAHYGCMVDLLGRAGLLGEAELLIGQMPMQPDMATLCALLAACRAHGDLVRGERIAQCALALDPGNSAPYILLANMYVAAGRQDDVAKVRKLMESRASRVAAR